MTTATIIFLSICVIATASTINRNIRNITLEKKYKQLREKTEMLEKYIEQIQCNNLQPNMAEGIANFYRKENAMLKEENMKLMHEKDIKEREHAVISERYRLVTETKERLKQQNESLANELKATQDKHFCQYERAQALETELTKTRTENKTLHERYDKPSDKIEQLKQKTEELTRHIARLNICERRTMESIQTLFMNLPNLQYNETKKLELIEALGALILRRLVQNEPGTTESRTIRNVKKFPKLKKLLNSDAFDMQTTFELNELFGRWDKEGTTPEEILGFCAWLMQMSAENSAKFFTGKLRMDEMKPLITTIRKTPLVDTATEQQPRQAEEQKEQENNEAADNGDNDSNHPIIKTFSANSEINFGPYRGRTIQEIMEQGGKANLVIMYYNSPRIDYSEDVLDALGITPEVRIQKPGKRKNGIYRWHRNIANHDPKEADQLARTIHRTENYGKSKYFKTYQTKK